MRQANQPDGFGFLSQGAVSFLHLGTVSWNSNLARVRAGERGRQANVHGVDSPHAVLNEDQVKYIKQYATKSCRVNGYSAIARRFGVSDVMVRLIALGKQWKHLEI